MFVCMYARMYVGKITLNKIDYYTKFDTNNANHYQKCFNSLRLMGCLPPPGGPQAATIVTSCIV